MKEINKVCITARIEADIKEAAHIVASTKGDKLDEIQRACLQDRIEFVSFLLNIWDNEDDVESK